MKTTALTVTALLFTAINAVGVVGYGIEHNWLLMASNIVGCGVCATGAVIGWGLRHY